MRRCRLGLNIGSREGLSRGRERCRDQGEALQTCQRSKGPGVGACWMCPQSHVAEAEGSRERGGLQARTGTLAFTVGDLEAAGSLGCHGGAA